MAAKGTIWKRKVKSKVKRPRSSIPPGPAGPADVSGSQVGRFRCNACGTPFPSKDLLDVHMQQAHKSL